jgi:hypothetical protein
VTDNPSSGKGKKHWLLERNPITDLMIVACAAFLTGAVGSILVEINAPHDFSISIEPVSKTSNFSRPIYPELAVIQVNNSRWLKKYDHSICLYCNRSEVEFKPQTGKVPFSSIISIKPINKSALKEENELKIYAIGGDETKRSCTFILYVKNDQLTTKETQGSIIDDAKKDFKNSKNEMNGQNYVKSLGI